MNFVEKGSLMEMWCVIWMMNYQSARVACVVVILLFSAVIELSYIYIF